MRASKGEGDNPTDAQTHRHTDTQTQTQTRKQTQTQSCGSLEWSKKIENSHRALADVHLAMCKLRFVKLQTAVAQKTHFRHPPRKRVNTQVSVTTHRHTQTDRQRHKPRSSSCAPLKHSVAWQSERTQCVALCMRAMTATASSITSTGGISCTVRGSVGSTSLSLIHASNWVMENVSVICHEEREVERERVCVLCVCLPACVCVRV